MSRHKFLFEFQNNSSDKSFINYFSTENAGFSVTFYEFNKITDGVYSFLSKLFDENLRFVGVCLSDYLWLPCLLLSIWKSGGACACIGPRQPKELNLNFINKLEVKYIISDDESDNFRDNSELMSTFQINSRKFYVWKRNVKIASSIDPNIDFCYGIMTSGSTGVPKIIRVPWSCILSNVYELIHLLSVNIHDNIYLSSPFTFDPFFVELFLSMIVGCKLTIVSPKLRFSPKSLLKIFFGKQNYCFEGSTSEKKGDETSFTCQILKISNSSITVIQMTPSIFKRWNTSSIENVILSDSSELRILLLGGERFPTEILKLRTNRNKTKIYNIYGITEISCWAFINELSVHNEDISLGMPIGDITYKVNEKNEFLVGSRLRKCLVDNEESFTSDEVLYRKTGDVVAVKADKIFYLRRSNQLVKKFGVKINLQKIENIFLNSCSWAAECYCIMDEAAMKVALFYPNTKLEQDYLLITKSAIMQNMSSSLTSIEVPDYVIEIKQTPLNENGKCDKIALLKIFRNVLKAEGTDRDAVVVFRRIWDNVLECKNFLDSGGDSVKALQLMTGLQEAGIEVPGDFLKVLLENGDFEKCLSCLTRVKEPGTSDCDKIEQGDEKMKYEFSVLWSFDMSKCIDASPAVFNVDGLCHIVVGSHSSKLSCIQGNTGREVWTVKLGDRIESGFCVNESSTFGVVGCYDHHAYCLSISDGRIIWKLKTEGMIKSTPCLTHNEKAVYVASYDTYLYRLSTADGSLISKTQLGSRGVFCSGIQSAQLMAFFIATLEGNCICLRQTSDEVMWKHRLESPIFASPVLIEKTKYDSSVIFAEVTGYLSCFNAETGSKIWRYKCGGNVYSTPVYSSELESIVFGCYDSRGWCLKLAGKPVPEWAVALDSPVFCRPCLLCPPDPPRESLVALATTRGWVYLCALRSGSVVARIKLNGEVFSSPKASDGSLVVGCRDNKLHCLKISRAPPTPPKPPAPVNDGGMLANEAVAVPPIPPSSSVSFSS